MNLTRKETGTSASGKSLFALVALLPYMNVFIILCYFMFVDDREKYTPPFFIFLSGLFGLEVYLRRLIEWFHTPVDNLIILFFITFGIGSLVSYDLIGGWYGYLYLLLALNGAYAGLDFLKDAQRLKWAIRFVGVFNIATAAVGLKQMFELGLEVSSIFPCPNHYGMYLLLTIPPLFILSEREEGRVWRVALLLGVVVSLGALLLTYTRAAMLGLVGESIVLIVYRFRFRLMVSMFVVGFLIAIPFCGRFAGDFAYSLSSVEHRTNYLRFYSWDAALKMIEERPVWGFGFFSYENTYPPYQLVQTTTRDQEPHCLYLDLGTMMGIPGIMILLGAIFHLFSMVIKFLASKTPPVERYRYEALSFLILLTGILTMCFIEG